MRFEKARIAKIVDSERGPALNLKEVLTRAHEVIKQTGGQIEMEEFAPLYGANAVNKDFRRVENRRAKILTQDDEIAAQNAVVAEIFEAITLQEAELSNWLGESVYMLKTSPYDDYFNGVDLLATWHEGDREPHVLVLAVDVTFGAGAVQRKLEHIKGDISSGDMGTIKYFKTEDGRTMGQCREFARVVIGIEKSAVVKLAGLWMRGDKRALGTHPVQRVMAEEIYIQLGVMEQFASREGRHDIADIYKRIRNVFETVYKQKARIPLGELNNDSVHQVIARLSKDLFSR